VLLLVYGFALLTATLLSEWSNRTVLSSAVLFLVFGFVAGPAGLGLVTIDIDSALVSQISELALFAILFSDGLKVGWQDLRRAWRLPGRALLIGMPLTAGAVAILARLLLGVAWTPALLIGAILSPTDPVFASAILGRAEIPGRVRHLLNVESGLNDGLALPFVIFLISVQTHGTTEIAGLIGEVLGGLFVGMAVAATAGWMRNLRIFSVATSQEALVPFAIAIVILAIARVTQWNEYLAAYAGGLTLATVSPRAREEFHGVGERLSEVLKLAAVLVLAVTLGAVATHVRPIVYVFAVAVLTAARALAIGVALVGSGLAWTERLVAAWFGPKGFASVIYGLLLLRSGVPDAASLFQLVAITTVMSIVLHSSTDVPIAHYFRRRHSAQAHA